MTTPHHPPPYSPQHSHEPGPPPPLPPSMPPLPPSLPPLPPSLPPSLSGPSAPGSIYDTRLASDPLPPTPLPPTPLPPSPLPPPIWAFDGDLAQPRTPAPPVQDQQAVAFESAVRAEIKQLESYFARQTRRFRLFGMATVVCAAGVPVLIAAGVWSWLAAAFGAIAAVSGSLQTLYRYQDSALSAMSLATNLESEVVRYQTGTTPYLPGSPANFNLFVDRVTNLRKDGSASFSGVWSSAQVSTGS